MPGLRRRAFYRSRPRGRRPTYEWVSTLIAAEVAANTTVTSVDLLSGFVSAWGADVLGWTIRRVIIDGTVGLDADVSAETSPLATWQAYAYVSDRTHTSFFNDVWPSGAFWNRRGALYAANDINTGNAPAGMGIERIHADLRVTRKLRDLDDNCRLFYGNSTATGPSVVFALNFNVLISKL